MDTEAEETTKYLRLILLFISIGTDIVCKVFKHYAIQTGYKDVTAFLTNYETRRELDKLRSKNVLSNIQFNMVTANIPRVEQFDISLLIKLLCNLFCGTIEPPKEGWLHKKPAPTDVTLGADLIRLRNYRNKIVGHSARARISDHLFNDYWKDLETIFLRICRNICPNEEYSIKENVRECKIKILDQKTEQWCREKIESLRKICKDIVELQEQVEKLISETKEFSKYFKERPERYSRYIRLLFEGGQLVLSAVLQRECSRNEKNITVLLQQNMEAITNQIGAEDNVQPLLETDPEKWDILHSAKILLLLFKDTLKSTETRHINVLLDARLDYSKIAVESLDEASFNKRNTELVKSLLVLSHDLSEQKQNACEQCIDDNSVAKEITNDDIHEVEEYFGQLEMHGLKIRKLSDVYKDTLDNLKNAMKKMEDEDIGFKIEPVFQLKMITLGTDEQKRKLAEQTLETVWRAALEGTGSSDRFDDVRRVVEKILEEIRQFDIRAADVETKCILLSLICPSPRSVLELLKYIESNRFKEQCFLMSYELCDILEDALAVSASLTIESLYAISKNTVGGRDDASVSEDLTLPLAFGSVKGIRQTLDFVEAESTKTSLSTIAEKLSEKVDDKISLKLEVDLMCFSEIFSRSEGTSGEVLRKKHDGSDLSEKPLPIDPRQLSSKDHGKRKDSEVGGIDRRKKHRVSGPSLQMTHVKLWTSKAEVLSEEAKEDTIQAMAESSAKRMKEILEKNKARKKRKVEVAEPQASGSQTQTQIRTETEMALMDIYKYKKSCRIVIDKVEDILKGFESLSDESPHKEYKELEWRIHLTNKLSDVKKTFDLPVTKIALVGNTGAGKSSLINALLNRAGVLPTQGMRACTAVAVEVFHNKDSTLFVADIEFLSRKEWNDEIQILVNDLTDEDGTIQEFQPDPNSDTYASYCKVMAVYGKIESYEKLPEQTMVTKKLGEKISFESHDPEEFREKIAKYIETQEPGTGQLWPIVKRVQLKLPDCDVCSSGATLVDLPGGSDSNAARNKIADEHMKTCSAVWLVSNINRAIDDQSARNLLNKVFRQLLMDGQYGNITFICTKTDDVDSEEIVRSLKQGGEIYRDILSEISTMKEEKSDLDKIVSNGMKEQNKLQNQESDLMTEITELKDDINELNNLLETTEAERTEAIKELEQDLKQKESQLSDTKIRIGQLEVDKKKQKMMQLEKAIDARCIRARNDYCKRHIKRKVRAEIQNMKRRAGTLHTDDSDDNANDGSDAENVLVFCCSSTEYRRIHHLFTSDSPKVFSTEDDTQIPELRKYVHEMMVKRQRQSLERLIQKLGALVSDLTLYIAKGLPSSHITSAKTAVEAGITKCEKTVKTFLEQLSTDIDRIFDETLKGEIEEGTKQAILRANSTCAKWNAGDLRLSTYRAIVSRDGKFKSKTYGDVDFNAELAEPLNERICAVWLEVFGSSPTDGVLRQTLEQFTDDCRSELQTLNKEIVQQLNDTDVAKDLDHVCVQAYEQLKENVSNLQNRITFRQRDISRIVTPHVQANLQTEYEYCKVQRGEQMFKRIKSCIEKGVDGKRKKIFSEVKELLMSNLLSLKEEIKKTASEQGPQLCMYLRHEYNLILEAPSRVLRNQYEKEIKETDRLMQSIYDKAGLKKELVEEVEAQEH